MPARHPRPKSATTEIIRPVRRTYRRPLTTRSLLELAGQDDVSVLIVAGQGTYEKGKYSSEHPDHDCSLPHANGTEHVREAGRFTLVVPSGGFTQPKTPDLSEAQSFINIWRETRTVPGAPIVLDQVALDSAENVIFGLMAARMGLTELGIDTPISRIGYYSQWRFKKKRMVKLAERLGIMERFYFEAYVGADRAYASEPAKMGEEAQFMRLQQQDDFLLLGPEWEGKRRQRFQVAPDILTGNPDKDGEIRAAEYLARTAHLREAFPETFAALDSLKGTVASELQPYIAAEGHVPAEEVLRRAKEAKYAALCDAFEREVRAPRG